MNLSSIEQETIINYNQGEAEATVFTYDKALIRKLERLREKNPAVELLREEKTGAREYRFPKRWLKVVPPRERSAEEIERRRQQGKASFATNWNRQEKVPRDISTESTPETANLSAETR